MNVPEDKVLLPADVVTGLAVPLRSPPLEEPEKVLELEIVTDPVVSGTVLVVTSVSVIEEFR